MGVLMGLFSCSTNGDVVVFTAGSLAKTPVKQEKTIRIEDHYFIFFNVYNDGEGSFVMADNSSYIRNYDVQFGLRVNSKWAHDISKADKNTPNDFDNYALLEGSPYMGTSALDFFVVNFGIEIRGIGFFISAQYENINIGTIANWC